MSKELLKEPEYRSVVMQIRGNVSMTKEEIHGFINKHEYFSGMNIFYDLLATNIIVEKNGRYYVRD